MNMRKDAPITAELESDTKESRISPIRPPGVEELAQRVKQALCDRGYCALLDVRVSVCEEAVLLEGLVRSYYLKQLAQETALAVDGVNAVRNELVVVRDG
jgi:osmotically-inducible protein OsmY